MKTLRTHLYKSLQIAGLYLTIFIVSTGCLLDIAGVNQAEEELARIPEVTSVPTKERPSPTPVPDQPTADPLLIATEVANTKATTAANATATPTPIQNAPEEAPNVPYPILEDGYNFRHDELLLWYNSAESAAEIQEILVDQMTFFRWDKYEFGETGEGYFDVQFEKNFEPLQISVWENEALEHTSIVVYDVDSMLELIPEIPSATLYEKWLVILDENGELPESAGGDLVEYTTTYPLPIVRLFYTLRMLDAGWELIPTTRSAPYGMDLQFFNDDGQRLVLIVRDNGTGTTITLVE